MEPDVSTPLAADMRPERRSPAVPRSPSRMASRRDIVSPRRPSSRSSASRFQSRGSSLWWRFMAESGSMAVEEFRAVDQRPDQVNHGGPRSRTGSSDVLQRDLDFGGG